MFKSFEIIIYPLSRCSLSTIPIHGHQQNVESVQDKNLTLQLITGQETLKQKNNFLLYRPLYHQHMSMNSALEVIINSYKYLKSFVKLFVGLLNWKNFFLETGSPSQQLISAKTLQKLKVQSRLVSLIAYLSLCFIFDQEG